MLNKDIERQNVKQRYRGVDRIMDRMINKDIERQTELWTECLTKIYKGIDRIWTEC